MQSDWNRLTAHICYLPLTPVIVPLLPIFCSHIHVFFFSIFEQLSLTRTVYKTTGNKILTGVICVYKVM